MKKLFFIILLIFSFKIAAQTTTSDSNMSEAEKEVLYNKFAKEVKHYSLKEFENLFFEYQKKIVLPEILSKEDFYNYTIKIAAFSERLIALYPSEKETALQNKKDWLSKTYDDYLKTKKK